MSDKDNLNIDNIEIDDEEYAKALSVLESSKSIRLKDVEEKRKAENLAKKKAAREAARKASEAKVESLGIKNKFIAKCVTDPIIPICLLVALVSVILVVCFYIVPMFSTPTLGFTVEEFKNSYSNNPIYIQSLKPYGFELNDFTFYAGENNQTQSSVALTADPTLNNSAASVDRSNLIYFNTPISNTAVPYATALQGSCRKSDNKVTAIRILVGYNDSDGYYDFLRLYYSVYLQTVCPELSNTEAVDLITAALSDVSNNTFTIRGDIAYRVVIETTDVTYIALDIVPADNVSASAVNTTAPSVA